MSKSKVSLLLVAAILFLSCGNCLNPWLADQASTKCCASMPCAPANQTHECCKTDRSSLAKYFKPATKTHVAPPALIATATVTQLGIVIKASFLPNFLDARQHAPPSDLYTVYHSLLI